MARQPHDSGKSMKIATIDGGQSAAEALIDLNDSYPSVQADTILCTSALEPVGDSPLVSEVLAPKLTDLIYSHEHVKHECLPREYHNTSYSVMDTDLIEHICGVSYHQEVSGTPCHTSRCMTTAKRVTATTQGIELVLRDAGSGELSVEIYDAVILATGYEHQLHRRLLEPLAEYLGDYKTGRDHRLQAGERCRVAIYAQGFSQASHSLSDTLLSVLPVHAKKISGSLYQHLRPGVPARALHEHALAS